MRDWVKNRPLIVGGTIIMVAVTFISTLGSLYFLSATPGGERLRRQLGIDELKTFSIASTKTEKLVIEESSAFIEVSKKVQPAVVSIAATSNTLRNVIGFGVIQAPTTAGTGFIIASDGLIVTNKHVVKGSDKFTVTTFEGNSYDAKVVATDPTNDIAFLTIEAKGLPVVDLGDYDKLQIGQWVMAVGNALGELQNTVTVGVVSAKERTAEPTDGNGNVESLSGLIQTDAAINPGNSGGPLVNLAGQLVGINTAVRSDAQNIGFAIPVDDVKHDLEQYRKSGKITPPYIGIRYQTITKATAKSLNLKVDQGALLDGSAGNPVQKDSPAEKAGLRASDIITKINNDKLSETQPLTRLIRQYNPGETVKLTILRDGKEQSINLTLADYPTS